MFQSVAPEVDPDDPAKRGQLASFYPFPPYSWSCEVFPLLLQLCQLRYPSAITNRVENYLCVSAGLVFFSYFRSSNSGGFDNHWSCNKNSIMSLFLEVVGKREKEASSLLFSSSELLDQLSTSLHHTL